MAITSLLARGGNGSAERTIPACVAATTDLYATADGAATVTITASATSPVYIKGVVCSYTATPTGGALTIAEGVTPVFSVDLPTAGPHVIPVELIIAAGSNAVITLADPGGAIVGKLNVNAYRLQ